MKNLFDKYGKKKVYGGAGGILVLIIALIVAICVVMSNQNKLVLNDKSLVVELGEEVSMKPSSYLDAKVDRAIANDTVLKSELLTNKDKFTLDEKKQTVVSKDKEYLEVGKYDIALSYKKEELKITIEVKDTKAPVFKDILKEVVVEQNAEDVDFTKFFQAEDLSEFKISVDDKAVDLSKVGDYKLKVIAKDRYDNEVSKEVKVRVLSLEDAKKDDTLTKTLDGTTYQSKAMKEKIEEEKKVEEEKKAQEENANNGGVANSGGSANNGGGNSNTGGGGGTPQAPTPHPNGIGAVINTAYGFVGRTDMSCSDMVKQAFSSNGYTVPNGLSYNIGYSVGTNTSIIQAGDMIITDNHIMLVASVSGTNITAIEGGMNGTNVVVSNHVVGGSEIWFDGYSRTTILDIRRV